MVTARIPRGDVINLFNIYYNLSITIAEHIYSIRNVNTVAKEW